MLIGAADIARFWPKVDRRGESECWLWTAAKNNKGYGMFGLGGKLVLAHRFAYELLVGPVPEGLVLDHVKNRGCTSTLCVNPAHLEPVTRGENVLRGDGPVAQLARQTHCQRGHELGGENTIRGCGRRCKTCVNERRRALRAVQAQEEASERAGLMASRRRGP